MHKIIVISCIILLASCGEQTQEKSETIEELDSTVIIQEDSLTDIEPVDSFLWIGSQKFLVTEAEDQNLWQGRLVNTWLKEDSLLALYPDVERADELTLKLGVQNDSIKVVKDIPMADDGDLDCAFYSFQGDIPNSNYWELWATGYECHWTVLMNKTTGDTTLTWGRPVVSPKGSYLLTGNPDLEAAYTYNGIELFELNNNDISLIGKIELPDWGPYSLKWIDNKSILITSGKIDWNNGYDMQHKNVLLTMIED